MSLAGKVAAAKAAWKGSYYAAKVYLDLRARYAAWRKRMCDAGSNRGVAGGDRGKGWGMKHGFTEILLVALIAAAGIGITLARRQARRFDVPQRYRGQVKRAMSVVEAKTGLEWPEGQRIRVHPVRGQKLIDGWWAVWIESEQKWKYGFAYNVGHTVVVTDLQGRMPDLILKHELAHQLYWAHGISGDEHHALMRRNGIPDALTPGGPPGGY